MNDVAATKRVITRELALHALYEAAELEHNLMCTYLYAAFSLKDGVVAEGLAPDEAEAVSRWRLKLIRVAVEEMQHLAAVWNITSALGGSGTSGQGSTAHARPAARTSWAPTGRAPPTPARFRRESRCPIGPIHR